MYDMHVVIVTSSSGWVKNCVQVSDRNDAIDTAKDFVQYLEDGDNVVVVVPATDSGGDSSIIWNMKDNHGKSGGCLEGPCQAGKEQNLCCAHCEEVKDCPDRCSYFVEDTKSDHTKCKSYLNK